MERKEKNGNGLRHPLGQAAAAGLLTIGLAFAALVLSFAYKGQWTLLAAALIPLHIGELLSYAFVGAVYAIGKVRKGKRRLPLTVILGLTTLVAGILLITEAVLWYA